MSRILLLWDAEVIFGKHPSADRNDMEKGGRAPALFRLRTNSLKRRVELEVQPFFHLGM
jgi:hypothetical protein